MTPHLLARGFRPWAKDSRQGAGELSLESESNGDSEAESESPFWVLENETVYSAVAR